MTCLQSSHPPCSCCPCHPLTTQWIIPQITHYTGCSVWGNKHDSLQHTNCTHCSHYITIWEMNVGTNLPNYTLTHCRRWRLYIPLKQWYLSTSPHSYHNVNAYSCTTHTPQAPLQGGNKLFSSDLLWPPYMTLSTVAMLELKCFEILNAVITGQLCNDQQQQHNRNVQLWCSHYSWTTHFLHTKITIHQLLLCLSSHTLFITFC